MFQLYMNIRMNSTMQLFLHMINLQIRSDKLMITSFIIILILLKGTIYSVCLLYNVLFWWWYLYVFRFCQNHILSFKLYFIIFDSIFKINFISTCDVFPLLNRGTKDRWCCHDTDCKAHWGDVTVILDCINKINLIDTFFLQYSI